MPTQTLSGVAFNQQVKTQFIGPPVTWQKVKSLIILSEAKLLVFSREGEEGRQLHENIFGLFRVDNPQSAAARAGGKVVSGGEELEVEDRHQYLQILE